MNNAVPNRHPCNIRPMNQVYLDFRFCDLLDNLLTSSDAFIHAGFNVMKTLWRSIPNG